MLISFGLGSYLVILFLVNKISYYISPSYFGFNLVMGILLIAFSLNSFRHFSHDGNHHEDDHGAGHEHEGIKKISQASTLASTSVYIILFLSIILIPARPLSSATASSRSLNIAALVTTGADVNPLLQRDTKTLKLSDWVKIFNFTPDLASYVGKPVIITGFIFPSPEAATDKNNFFVGKFVITCCAVDAAPLGIEIKNTKSDSTSWLAEFKYDDWVKVEGVWELVNVGTEHKLVLVASNISAISRPENPYEQ